MVNDLINYVIDINPFKPYANEVLYFLRRNANEPFLSVEFAAHIVYSKGGTGS
jgi:hypothetical protein